MKAEMFSRGTITAKDFELFHILDNHDEIIKTIKASFPDHDILAEESKKQKRTSDYRWIIDPLDGTTNYLHGLPLFATCIALEYKGEIILGVINLPVEKGLYFAQKGFGAYKNYEKISILGWNSNHLVG